MAKSDLNTQPDRRYSGRFLNISNPWKDQQLRNWTGYSETRYFDSENRRATSDAAGARRVEMIPLALYGLNHPKIPAVLIDFRHSLNPKKREMSRRLFNDVAKNMLSLSSALTNLPLDRCTAEVRAQVQAMLPAQGHTEKEADFLNHMLSVRARVEPESVPTLFRWSYAAGHMFRTRQISARSLSPRKLRLPRE